PWITSTTMAVLAIGACLMLCMSIITSLNILPIDLFGSEKAAFTVAILASAYSLVQVFVAPLIGMIVDHYGFAAVCVAVSTLPFLGVAFLNVVLLGHGKAAV